jgi:hypothetical protein
MAPPLAGHFLGDTHQLSADALTAVRGCDRKRRNPHQCTVLCQQWDAMEGKQASVRQKDQVALVEVGESLSHLTRSGRIPKVGKEPGDRWGVIGPGRSDLHPVSLSARRGEHSAKLVTCASPAGTVYIWPVVSAPDARRCLASGVRIVGP